MPKETVVSELKNLYDVHEESMLYHHKKYNLFLSDEVIFFVRHNRIYNICITEYFLGIPLTIIFHHRDQDYTYTIIGLKNKKIITF